MKIGLYGGSFNPPHISHGLMCYYILETTDIEKIWIIPTYRHAFSKILAPYEDRLEMCRYLAEPFGDKVFVSDLEKDFTDISYTIDTVKIILKRYPEHIFEWIVGSDIIQELDKWKDINLLKQLISFKIVGRSGYTGGNSVELPAISSTRIRYDIQNQKDISQLVPKKIKDYIEKKQLYQKNI